MSAGAFLSSKYETTKTPTRIVPIRIQPETAALVINGVDNDPPAAALGSGSWPSAKVSGSARSLGINARTVTVAFTGSPPTGYEDGSVTTIPWLQASTFNDISEGQTGTYLGAAIRVVGVRNEKVK